MTEWTEEDDLILEEAMQEVDFTEEELDMLAELGEYYEMNEVLNFMQRIKKSRVMKRLSKKLARLRKIASKKMKVRNSCRWQEKPPSKFYVRS